MKIVIECSTVIMIEDKLDTLFDFDCDKIILS